MESASRPWQAIAVAVCVLGLAFSGWPPPSEATSPLDGAETGQSLFSQLEETGVACILRDDTTALVPGRPPFSAPNGPSSTAIHRYLRRLGEFDESLSASIDLTWPSLIVDPHSLTAGMLLSAQTPEGETAEERLFPAPVAVVVFGDPCEWDAPSGVEPGAENGENCRVLGFLEMTVTSDATRVLYCDPGLMTEPNLFLVLSPVQSGPVTLSP